MKYLFYSECFLWIICTYCAHIKMHVAFTKFALCQQNRKLSNLPICFCIFKITKGDDVVHMMKSQEYMRMCLGLYITPVTVMVHIYFLFLLLKEKARKRMQVFFSTKKIGSKVATSVAIDNDNFFKKFFEKNFIGNS